MAIERENDPVLLEYAKETTRKKLQECLDDLDKLEKRHKRVNNPRANTIHEDYLLAIESAKRDLKNCLKQINKATTVQDIKDKVGKLDGNLNQEFAPVELSESGSKYNEKLGKVKAHSAKLPTDRLYTKEAHLVENIKISTINLLNRYLKSSSGFFNSLGRDSTLLQKRRELINKYLKDLEDVDPKQANSRDQIGKLLRNLQKENHDLTAGHNLTAEEKTVMEEGQNPFDSVEVGTGNFFEKKIHHAGSGRFAKALEMHIAEHKIAGDNATYEGAEDKWREGKKLEHNTSGTSFTPRPGKKS